jgi:aldose 1-epimerase
MKFQWIAGLAILLLIVLSYFLFVSRPAVKKDQRQSATFAVDSSQFGQKYGTPIMEYTLSNPSGMKVLITSYGGIVTHIWVPDRHGKPGDVVLGFDSLLGYLQADNPYIGALVGRYANRIAGAKFSLDGSTYHLFPNDHGNTLHGGSRGFDKMVWNAQSYRNDSSAGVRLRYRSADGEEGFPGNMDCEVVYTLTGNNVLRISYDAVTDKATPVNLTNHTYFNLGGPANGDVLTEDLTINADRFTEVDSQLIPTGKLLAVAKTPMDFRNSKKIGRDIARVSGGYDHNYILNGDSGTLRFAAKAADSASGRIMEMRTTEPGVQFYSGNFLNGTLKGKKEIPYTRHMGFCLEAQHFPNSPNEPSFPTTILHPGDHYRQITEYKFYTQ